MLSGDLTEEVARLKNQAGQNVLVFGSGELVSGLLQRHLLDELRLLVYPVILGRGKRLFEDGPPIALTVADTMAFSSGVVLLTYHPATSKE